MTITTFSGNLTGTGNAYTTVTSGLEDTLVFLGCYTDHSVLPHFPKGTREGDGIVVARWRDGDLDIIRTVPCLNPAVMKYHPRLNVLYVLSECIHQEGYITAYRVDVQQGDLTEVGRISMTGKSTCYMSFDKDAKYAVVTNYWDGILDVVEFDDQGVPLRIVQTHQQTRREQWRQVENREDHMANRQDGPHAHCVVFHPSYHWAFVPDLGDNGIHQYGWKEGRLSHQAFIPLPPRDGPRHFVFHPTLPVAYSGCELRSHVQVFLVDDANPDQIRPRITSVQSWSTLPSDFTTTNYVGEIKVSADGTHVYVSNRGHHSIAVFKVDPVNGFLSPVSIDLTGGKTPRHFGLSPCGRYAVVGNQDTDRVKVFNICPQRGALQYSGCEYDLASPNFVLFQVPHPTRELHSEAPKDTAVAVHMASVTVSAY